MNDLGAEYKRAEERPATKTLDYKANPSLPDDVLEDDRVFIIRNLLSSEECDELIQAGEHHGIEPPTDAAGTLRTAKRTSQYMNQELSTRLEPRIDDAVKAKIESNDGMGDFVGFHSNWRLVRYDNGDAFCAHQDQMDSHQVKKPDGSKDFIVSSHTLLIVLSEGTLGGATRFYPNCKVKTSELGQYEESVDVMLPKGWAIVFRQQGLIHAGQPAVSGPPKYVAQAGVLRLLPKDKLIQPNVFRLGPGLVFKPTSERTTVA